jgi:RNA ligase
MKLINLINKFGKAKINTLTKYPSILTLHKMGERGRLSADLTTRFDKEQMYATEKIDGTNVRIICLGDEYLIGSREFILHYSKDVFYDMAQSIVDGIKSINIDLPKTESLTVFYGELYGGKTSAHAKQYGVEKVGFRLFDVARFENLDILEQDLDTISKWRETESAEGIRYGQPFLNKTEFEKFKDTFELVPQIPFELTDFTHRSVAENLKKFIPTTNVALTESAQGRPEGVIFRNFDRSKIVKIRYEDYERTLK